MRKQKLNLAVYDNEFKPHVVKDIVISDKEELNKIEVEFKGPV